MLLAGTMTRMVASFVFVIYCADQLGVEGFGQYSIAIHYFELFLSITATAVGILLTRDLARWPRHSFQLMTSAIVLTMLMCVLAIAAMSFVGPLLNYSPETCQALLIASLALIPASACAVFEAVFVARERAEFLTVGVATESLLKIGISIALLAAGYGLIALMWTMLTVRLVLMFAYMIGLARIGSLGLELPSPSQPTIRELLANVCRRKLDGFALHELGRDRIVVVFGRSCCWDL